MGHVVCYRSGEVFISRYAPKGTLKIMKGDCRRIRWVLIACARHAYDGSTLLVPGVPEAKTDVEAMQAVKAFEQFLLKGLAAKRGRSRKGALV